MGKACVMPWHYILSWNGIISARPTWQGVKASALVFAGISSLDSADVQSWEEMGILWSSEHIKSPIQLQSVYFLTLNMLNYFKDYKRYIHILNNILDWS